MLFWPITNKQRCRQIGPPRYPPSRGAPQRSELKAIDHEQTVTIWIGDDIAGLPLLALGRFYALSSLAGTIEFLLEQCQFAATVQIRGRRKLSIHAGG